MKEVPFKSNDNITNLHGYIWEPNGNIKGIVHIIHGMNEHITLYDKIADILNKKGYIVVGYDLLGHGDSVIDDNHKGYFASSNSKRVIIEDTNDFVKIIKKKYKNIPYFMMGYSLGSIITRNYIEKYNEQINGALLLSSPYYNNFTMIYAKISAFIIQLFNGGWFYRSKFLFKQTNGKYNKCYINDKYKSWLTKDNAHLLSLSKDKKMKFKLTCNAYYTLFQLLQCNKTKIDNKDFPILILCGKDDPCTHFGKDIDFIKNNYIKSGLKKVKTKTYKNMRHSILFDFESKNVYEDIIKFLDLNILKDSRK